MDPLTDMTWLDHARCRGLPPDMFHPRQGEGEDASGNEAKRVCVDCEVREQCLDHAVRNNEDVGIWGGTGEDRRRNVRRIYLLSKREGNPWLYWRALAEEANQIGRTHGTNTEERPHTDLARCERCFEWVPAGRHPIDRNGPNAQCGVVATYNKGCRCRICARAKKLADREYRKGRRASARKSDGKVPETEAEATGSD